MFRKERYKIFVRKIWVSLHTYIPTYIFNSKGYFQILFGKCSAGKWKGATKCDFKFMTVFLNKSFTKLVTDMRRVMCIWVDPHKVIFNLCVVEHSRSVFDSISYTCDTVAKYFWNVNYMLPLILIFAVYAMHVFMLGIRLIEEPPLQMQEAIKYTDRRSTIYTAYSNLCVSIYGEYTFGTFVFALYIGTIDSINL